MSLISNQPSGMPQQDPGMSSDRLVDPKSKESGKESSTSQNSAAAPSEALSPTAASIALSPTANEAHQGRAELAAHRENFLKKTVMKKTPFAGSVAPASASKSATVKLNFNQDKPLNRVIDSVVNFFKMKAFKERTTFTTHKEEKIKGELKEILKSHVNEEGKINIGAVRQKVKDNQGEVQQALCEVLEKLAETDASVQTSSGSGGSSAVLHNSTNRRFSKLKSPVSSSVSEGTQGTSSSALSSADKDAPQTDVDKGKELRDKRLLALASKVTSAKTLPKAQPAAKQDSENAEATPPTQPYAAPAAVSIKQKIRDREKQLAAPDKALKERAAKLAAIPKTAPTTPSSTPLAAPAKVVSVTELGANKGVDADADSFKELAEDQLKEAAWKEFIEIRSIKAEDLNNKKSTFMYQLDDFYVKAENGKVDVAKTRKLLDERGTDRKHALVRALDKLTKPVQSTNISKGVVTRGPVSEANLKGKVNQAEPTVEPNNSKLIAKEGIKQEVLRRLKNIFIGDINASDLKAIDSVLDTSGDEVNIDLALAKALQRKDPNKDDFVHRELIKVLIELGANEQKGEAQAETSAKKKEPPAAEAPQPQHKPKAASVDDDGLARAIAESLKTASPHYLGTTGGSGGAPVHHPAHVSAQNKDSKSNTEGLSGPERPPGFNATVKEAVNEAAKKETEKLKKFTDRMHELVMGELIAANPNAGISEEEGAAIRKHIEELIDKGPSAKDYFKLKNLSVAMIFQKTLGKGFAALDIPERMIKRMSLFMNIYRDAKYYVGLKDVETVEALKTTQDIDFAMNPQAQARLEAESNAIMALKAANDINIAVGKYLDAKPQTTVRKQITDLVYKLSKKMETDPYNPESVEQLLDFVKNAINDKGGLNLAALNKYNQYNPSSADLL